MGEPHVIECSKIVDFVDKETGVAPSELNVWQAYELADDAQKRLKEVLGRTPRVKDGLAILMLLSTGVEVAQKRGAFRAWDGAEEEEDD